MIAMKIEGGKDSLLRMLILQLRNRFELSTDEMNILSQFIDLTLESCSQHFIKINNKYYRASDGTVIFNPLHGGQYCIFLYRLSYFISKKSISLADKLYHLNRQFSCCELYHQVKLPNYFFLEHPVGSVIGRAQIGEYFSFQQNCTVGGNSKFEYPVLGKNVKMFSGAMIIGNSIIGDNVFIGAGAIVKDERISSNSIVFGQSPNLTIKKRSEGYFGENSVFDLRML